MKILPNNITYRPEIDGLRALAVLAVIAYHFNRDLIPSGYLGVDIFFVISGYVITASLVNNKSNLTLYDFVIGFYARRVKRIIPALVFCVLLTAILISLFNPLPDVSLKTGIASLFGLSNLYLLKQSVDYFGFSSELNPFTHTWSLGVEEQFYILFPLLVWVTRLPNQTNKASIFFLISIGLFSFISLIMFIYFNMSNKAAAYFIMPTRLWELGVGSFIYIACNKTSNLNLLSNLVNPTIVAMLLFFTLFIPTQFVVVATISVVFFTALLIVSMRKKTIIYDIFTTKGVVYIGLISYSLYLWHWSILVISKWTIDGHSWAIPFQILTIVILSIFSYHIIETPVRKYKSKKSNFVIITGVSVCIFSAGLLLAVWKYEEYFYLGNRSEATNFANVKLTNINRENCHSVKPSTSFSKCKISVSDKNTIYFSGDSHTLHLHHAAKFIADTKLASIQIYSVGATLFPELAYTGWGYNEKQRDKYNRFQQERMSYILENIKKGDLIVLSSILQDYLEKDKFYSHENSVISKRQAIEAWKNKVINFADAVKSKGANTVIFLPLPRYTAMKFGASICSHQWFRVDSECSVNDASENREPLEKQRELAVNLLKQISSDRDNIFLFDPFAYLCSVAEEKCSLSIDGHPIFFDNTHLSNKTSEYIGLKLSEYLVNKSLIH